MRTEPRELCSQMNTQLAPYPAIAIADGVRTASRAVATLVGRELVRPDEIPDSMEGARG